MYNNYMYTPLKLFTFFQKSSQSFLDHSCNLFETNEKIPRESLDNYMKNVNLEEKKKNKKLAFYIIQNNIRNFMELTDNDFSIINDFTDEEKIILLKTSNQVISCLLTYLDI